MIIHKNLIRDVVKYDPPPFLVPAEITSVPG